MTEYWHSNMGQLVHRHGREDAARVRRGSSLDFDPPARLGERLMPNGAVRQYSYGD